MSGTVFVSAGGATPGAQPVASFTVSPSPAQTAQAVTFNGSASTDSDGTIAKYQWDLDGDGTFETDTGTTSTASRSYTAPATLGIKLRVTDDDGLTGETTRSLQVNAPPQPPRLSPAVSRSLCRLPLPLPSRPRR